MSTTNREETSMTSEEMLERNSSWTLACDNALLNRLKRFSEDLTRNSQEILRECDTLSTSVTQLDYRLINLSNEFLMLSNTQFVENRVEEFEEYSSSVSSASVSTSFKSKAEKEAALVSKMKQAIQLGLAACNERRQGNETHVNRFKRKQPYLIGSPKFFSSKYCGLVDESRRQQVPIRSDDPFDTSVSIPQIDDQQAHISVPQTQGKPEVTFTMPPTPVFPIMNPGAMHHGIGGDNYMENPETNQPPRQVVPPSPTISSRSSDIGARSNSSISREHVMPRSVTDELNKIYGSFAPPPTADADSDDDFRPSAGVGRLFDDDDDDDIFGEKELFPQSQKKTDFFGRSNPTQQLPAPVFSVPPPVDPVLLPQSKPFAAASEAHTLAGSEPKANDIPNKSTVTGDTTTTSNNDAVVRGPPPEAEGPLRSKLPPGAVSMFGGLPPPVFNNGTLQPAAVAQTASFVSPSSLVAKPDTQISSNSSVEGVVAASGRASSAYDQDSSSSVVVPSQKREEVNHRISASQPSHDVAVPGRSQNINNSRRGSLSGSGVGSSKPKTPHSVPVSSLFDGESSDEDIFLSNKKQNVVNSKPLFQDNPPPAIHVPKAPVNLQPPPAVNKHLSKQVKKSIFDDSESEDDLFSSRPTSKAKKTTTSNSLFNPEVKKPKLPAVNVVKGKSLFGDDDSDSDTDLFGNKKKVQKFSGTKAAVAAKTPPVRVPPKMEDVKMDSDSEDLFKEAEQQSTRKKGSIEAVTNDAHIYNNNNKAEYEPIFDEKPVRQSSSSDSIENKAKELSKLIIEEEEKVKPVTKLVFDDSKEISAVKREDSVFKPVKKSIFDDSESDDDDLFASKPAASVPSRKQNDRLFSEENRPVVPASTADKRKRVSLFEDDTDSDSELFGAKSKKNGFEKSATSEKDAIAESSVPKAEVNVAEEKTASADKPNSDEVDAAGLALKEVQEKEDSKQEDEPKSSKAIGNKISEKIKAMQTTKGDSGGGSPGKTSSKNIKGKVSVKNLALNLNINPLALKVGAKPPKASTSTPTTPDKESSDDLLTTNESTTGNVSPEKSNDEVVVKKDSVKKLALNLNINPLALKVGAKPPKVTASTPNTPDTDVSDPLSVNDASAEPSSEKSNAEQVIKSDSVKNLALNLNINPLALKVGAKPPKFSSSTPSTPDKEASDPPSINEDVTPALNFPDKPNAEQVIKSESDESIAETKPVEEDDDDHKTVRTVPKAIGVDDLVGILKARVRIQKKRRPPTRNFLKSLAVPNEQETEDQEKDELNDGPLEAEPSNEEKVETKTEDDFTSDKIEEEANYNDVEESVVAYV